MPYLTATAGPLKGKRFGLRWRMVIGRSFDADIRIDDLTVSRHHCQLTVMPDGCTVEDLGSGNGTFVNGDRISDAVPLKAGDLITISNTTFRFDPGAADASSVQIEERESAGEAPILETLDVQSTIVTSKLPAAEASLETISKAHERLRTVVEISNAVGGHLELEQLLNAIMDSIFRVFPQADRGFIMLREEGGDALEPSVSRQRGRATADTVTVSRHIIDEAIRRRAGVLSADAMGDQRFAMAVSVVNFQIRSMMCAPLIASDEVLGVIHVDTVRQGQSFTTEDLDLFTAIANQTALAIANARMHQRLVLRQRVERDLALARRVQMSFLPDAPPRIPGLEFGAAYQAAYEVGGDFYDFIPLQSDRFAIVVGDVAGKGMPAALMMARMMSDVRFLATTQPDPGRLLAKVNESVCLRGTEDVFVTMIYAVLDPKERRLQIANAAHCPPVLRRARPAEVVEIEERIGFPIGAVPGTDYQNDTLVLRPGDALFFFTDGVTEAMNSRKELYGKERLLGVLRKEKGSPTRLLEKIRADIQSFVGDMPQSDDLTLVAVGAV